MDYWISCPRVHIFQSFCGTEFEQISLRISMEKFRGNFVLSGVIHFWIVAENNEERWLGYIGAFFLANFRHGNRVFVNPLNWKMNSNPRIMKILVCKLCCFPFLYFYISFFFFFRINLSKIQNNFRSNFKFEMEVKEEESSVLNWLKFAVNSSFQNYFLIFPF